MFRNSGTLVTEYAGLSHTCLRILYGLSRVVGHLTVPQVCYISYILPCYNFWCICFSRIPPASGLRVNFIIKFCSVPCIRCCQHIKEFLKTKVSLSIVVNICIKQVMHSFCVYNQALTTASGSRLFGSVVRALDFWPRGPGLESRRGRIIFSYALFLFVTAFMS